MIRLVSILLLGNLACNAQANPSICEEKAVEFTFHAEAASTCNALKFEPQQILNTCDNGQGVLKDSLGDYRMLFRENDRWLARLDILNFSSNTLKTEILSLDLVNQTFSISMTVSDRNGLLISSELCQGRVTPSNN